MRQLLGRMILHLAIWLAKGAAWVGGFTFITEEIDTTKNTDDLF